MKIGYPCINQTLECRASRTFRLASYTTQRLIQTLDNNLACLGQILKYNVEHNILFFRISSDLVPFASHKINQYNWQDHYKQELRKLGAFIRKSNIRISMHPDQFTLINALDQKIVKASCRELKYHTQILDLMRLPAWAKIQIHIGGVYGNKVKSLKRFVRKYNKLEPQIKKRLVIENDDRSYTVDDCLQVHQATGIPVLLDILHHKVNNTGMNLKQALTKVKQTWRKKDGILMIDYSDQKKHGKKGQHAEHIDIKAFNRFLMQSRPYDFDIMLEIKDKEKSALKALQTAKRIVSSME